MPLDVQLQRLPVDYTEGDRLPVIGGRILKFDLTDYTLVLTLEQPDKTVVTRAGVIDDASAEGSTFHFDWEDGDLVVGNGQLCVVRMLDTDEKPETIARFLIDVARLPA